MTDDPKIPEDTLLEEYYIHLHIAHESMVAALADRKKSGLSEATIAARLGVSPESLEPAWRGDEPPSLRRLSALATAMDCRLVILFEKHENVGRTPGP